MKMSTKGRYGLRFMIDLATNGNAQNKVSLQQVAKRQAISEKYLWQIANRLKAAGLISAVPGAHGGYTITKKPAEITLAEVLEALEGNMTLVPCVKTASVCSRSGACISREVWKEINQKIIEAMKSITLGKILEKQSAMLEQTPLMYAI